ncbi:MAG TPA: FAD/NAD(P)-binding protein [Acidimicrobiales bacterium]|nr:FAD/NAD(P)-binding protein [Acidimicrobiales bacterium]
MAATADVAAESIRHPLVPSVWRVAGRREETSDVVTLTLRPGDAAPPAFLHGQFHMLTAFGVGEAAVSISGIPGQGDDVEHTIRVVGPVTRALCRLPVGGAVGVRGPYGKGWGIEEDGEDVARPTDYVVVAGGIGLAPLRGAVHDLAARQQRGTARLFVLAGAKTPDQILFPDDLARWRRAGAYVDVSVDVAPAGWSGTVGVVTALLPPAPFDPARAVALVCGPEVMMRFTAEALVGQGVEPERIRMSLERNMQCGCGLCGHCQLGPLLVCRDGPVVAYSGTVAELLRERQR